MYILIFAYKTVVQTELCQYSLCAKWLLGYVIFFNFVMNIKVKFIWILKQNYRGKDTFTIEI